MRKFRQHFYAYTICFGSTDSLVRVPLPHYSPGLWSRSRKEIYVESESVKMYRLRPQSKTLTRYSNSRALTATVTFRLILKYRL
jgi:hypothetical protein